MKFIQTVLILPSFQYLLLLIIRFLKTKRMPWNYLEEEWLIFFLSRRLILVNRLLVEMAAFH